jgi:predicted ATPase with chaperone activity
MSHAWVKIARRQLIFRNLRGTGRQQRAHGPQRIEAHCALTEPTLDLLHNAMADKNLSARAYDRILKVSRTIADLEGAVIGAGNRRSVRGREIHRDGQGAGWGYDLVWHVLSQLS